MLTMKKRVGIVSTWFARGSGQIAKQIIQAINWHTDYEIALLARMSIADGRKQLQFWGEYFFDNIENPRMMNNLTNAVDLYKKIIYFKNEN